MTKEQEIMDYLELKVFNPVLNSNTAPTEFKRGVNYTIMRMKLLSAEKMVQYFWSAISGTDRSHRFAKLMKDENFTSFEDVREEFMVKFDDKWLKL